MPRFTTPRVLCLTLALLFPLSLPTVDASARPFQNGDLFVTRSIKQDTGDRRFSFGANLQVAPIKALIKRQVEKEVDKIATENPEVKEVTEVLKDIDTQQLRALADSGELDKFKAALKEEMAAQGKTMSPEQEAAIDQIDANKLRLIADVVEIMNEPDDMMTFALEPYATLNFSAVQLTAKVAIAGFNSAAMGTSVELGNAGLDLRFGNRHGEVGKAFGWSLGVAGYGPTGTENANMIALSNIMAAPKYLHEYASGIGYAMIGMDLSFLQITLGGEYVHMVPVRKEADSTLEQMAYAHANLALLGYFKFVGVSAELDSLFNIKNAAAMDQTLLGTVGLRFYLGFVHLGAAVQTRLMAPDSPDKGFAMGGVGTGKMADFNFLVNAQFNFGGEGSRPARLSPEPDPAPLNRLTPVEPISPPSGS